MNSLLFLHLLAVLIPNIIFGVPSKDPSVVITNDQHTLANVRIYSNLAEIIQPLGQLPLEFSNDEWSNIRSDSVTLVGSNVNVTRQTITEKKISFNDRVVYVRSPSSTSTHEKFVKATIIDEDRKLVRFIDNDIGKEPIYLTVQLNDMLYIDEPLQSKFYVNFSYNTTDRVYVSYLRSNLNWKTRYELDLFEESKNPIFIIVADIRNDGKSKVGIQYAELLGGDINLEMQEKKPSLRYEAFAYANKAKMAESDMADSEAPPTVQQGKEVAGLYAFTINQPFSIDAKTNYLLPMFRPQATVERYGLIHKPYFSGAGKSNGKAQRTYRFSTDRFISRGNCMIREYDRLVGETFLPDLAAKDLHEFSIGEDSDIIYKEDITLVSSHTYNETNQSNNKTEQRTQSVYNVNILFKNYKNNRSVNVQFKQTINGRWVKLITSNGGITQDGELMESKMTLAANEEKPLSYKVEIIN